MTGKRKAKRYRLMRSRGRLKASGYRFCISARPINGWRRIIMLASKKDIFA